MKVRIINPKFDPLIEIDFEGEEREIRLYEIRNILLTQDLTSSFERDSSDEISVLVYGNIYDTILEIADGISRQGESSETSLYHWYLKASDLEVVTLEKAQIKNIDDLINTIEI